MKSVWISDEAWSYLMKVRADNPKLKKTLSQLVSEAILNNVKDGE